MLADRAYSCRRSGPATLKESKGALSGFPGLRRPANFCRYDHREKFIVETFDHAKFLPKNNLAGREARDDDQTTNKKARCCAAAPNGRRTTEYPQPRIARR